MIFHKNVAKFKNNSYLCSSYNEQLNIKRYEHH